MPNLYLSPYWAGMIDGDGYIGRTIINKKKRPVISLRMTDEQTVKDFSETFNTSFEKLNTPTQKKILEAGNKQQWVSRAACKGAYEVIKKIQPWLLVKKDAALDVCSSYEGRVCEGCGTDIDPSRAEGSRFCCNKCYKKADGRKRQGNFVPILNRKEVVAPDRVFKDDDEHLSYFGGLCDAEGHFSSNTLERGGSRTVFQLKMIHEECVKEFADFFNVPYRPLTAPSHIKSQEEKGHSQAYVIHTDGKTTYNIAKRLLPFLRLKSKPASMIVAWHE